MELDKPAGREAQVPQGLKAVAAELEALEQNVTALHQRLTPVMHEVSMPAASEQKETVEQLVPLAAEFRRHCGQLKDVNQSIRSILDGLEL